MLGAVSLICKISCGSSVPIPILPPSGQSKISLSEAAFPVLVSYGCMLKPVLAFEVNVTWRLPFVDGDCAKNLNPVSKESAVLFPPDILNNSVLAVAFELS